MDIRTAIAELTARRDLPEAEMEAVVRAIMDGEATPAQIAGLLVALRMKGERVDEIVGAARAMRQHAMPVTVARAVVDTCGTGGDMRHTFNISTAAALIAAGAGLAVAKHGNRAMSGSVGGADVLEALGVRIDLDAAHVAACIDAVGIGFLFAQAFHPAMRHVAPVRRELGVRTLFNLLGPLTNPAGAQRQLLGVFARQWVEPLAQALGRLGSQCALVVHGEDGLDELSLTGPSAVAELRDGAVRPYRFHPRGRRPRSPAGWKTWPAATRPPTPPSSAPSSPGVPRQRSATSRCSTPVRRCMSAALPTRSPPASVRHGRRWTVARRSVSWTL